MKICRQRLINDGNKAIPKSCPTCKFGPCRNGLEDHHTQKPMRQRHNFTGKMCKAVANGKEETCFTLQQAIYRVHDFTNGTENKQGWVTLPCGTILEWDGHNWFIMGYNSDDTA